MSICSGIGNGIGGALGKWGSGLGSALGLGAVVDVATRAYTGYGLLDTLSVPYIECGDGRFATAMEWYGSGLKCPIKKPDPSQLTPTNSGLKSASNYASMIEALGGAVYPYVGTYQIAPINEGTANAPPESGHYQSKNEVIDKIGNTLNAGVITEGNGLGNVFGGGIVGGLIFQNNGWGGWSSQTAPKGYSFADIRRDPSLTQYFGSIMNFGRIIGLRAELPELPLAPPAGRVPPPPGFSPPKRREKEDCQEVSCPCLTPADIEKAVRKALGLMPFAPEKLIREMGAKIYAAPGPSLIPIMPANLVEAIAALVAANYMRSGLGRYPVLMPDSLIASDNPAGDAVPTTPLENQAEWIEWIIKQQDAVQGEWPIDITIADGIQRKPMKFENISEALAEMTGLIIQVAADADTAVNAACTAAGIAQKAVNAASIGQKNIECLIQCFGFRTGFKALFVQSAITPADPDDKNFNVKKFLTPSSQNLAVLTDNDDFDFQAICDRILRNTEIVRASVARNFEQDGLPGDFARNQRKYDAGEARKETEKAMENLETTLKQQNPQMQLKIKLNGTPNDSILGDNFVIKRPKT